MKVLLLLIKYRSRMSKMNSPRKFPWLLGLAGLLFETMALQRLCSTGAGATRDRPGGRGARGDVGALQPACW